MTAKPDAERAVLRFVQSNPGLRPVEIRHALNHVDLSADDVRSAIARLADRGAIAIDSDMAVTLAGAP